MNTIHAAHAGQGAQARSRALNKSHGFVDLGVPSTGSPAPLPENASNLATSARVGLPS